jgi:hypothetical protein
MSVNRSLSFVFGVTSALLLSSTAFSQSYAFTIDQGGSSIQQTLDVSVPLNGTLIGNYDATTTPDGTRTLPGVFGGSGNNPINFSATAVITGSNSVSPQGAFTIAIDASGTSVIIDGFQMDVLGGEIATVAATFNLVYDTFRTVSPTGFFLGGIELPIPLGDIELLSWTLEQTEPATFALVDTAEGSDLAGTVTFNTVFSFSFSGQELVTDPLPFALPLVGTLVESGKNQNLELGFISDFVFDQPVPAIEAPIENVPLPVPTILPPGGTANLLLSATSAEGTTGGEWSSTIIAVGEPSGCTATPDIDGNASVNGADLAALLSEWNQNGGPADLNCDGIVNGADLTEMLSAWTG